MSATARFYVKCPAYTVGPLTTREAAERTLRGIDKLGACAETHEIIEETTGRVIPVAGAVSP